MDPNETLRQIRAYAKQMREDTDPGVLRAHALDLAESVEALDEWLIRGGFLPDAWKRVTS